MAYSDTRANPHFKIRLPPGLKEKLAKRAAVANRTLTAEILYRLEMSFSGESLIAEIQTKDLTGADVRLQISEAVDALNRLKRRLTDDVVTKAKKLPSVEGY